MKYLKNANRYFVKHPDFNGLTHIILGMGFGILFTYPVAGTHPVRYAVTFMLLAVLAHFWAATHKP